MTAAFNLSQLANNLNTSGQLDATDGLTGAVPVANGGTGSTTASGARSNLGTNNAANITTGTIATARLGSGTANSTTFLRGDQTWATAGGTPSTTDVLNATAGASVGAVGTYAFLVQIISTSRSAGTNLAGSGLRYANADSLSTNSTTYSGTPSGTWKLMGYIWTSSGCPISSHGSVFLRIS